MPAVRKGEGRGKRPGYARVSAFRAVWDHIGKLRLDHVGPRTLAVVKVRGSAANECLAGLRFLGVVSDDGAVTDAYRAVQDGTPEALAKVVDRAYASLLQICPLPAESREQLEQAMMAAYDLKRGRMAMAAAALFEWLYEQTGREALREASGRAEAESRPAPHSPERRKLARPVRGHVEQGAITPPQVVFAISVCPGTTAADIRSMLAEVRAACNADIEERSGGPG
jgi:hypothetical protein